MSCKVANIFNVMTIQTHFVGWKRPWDFKMLKKALIAISAIQAIADMQVGISWALIQIFLL